MYVRNLDTSLSLKSYADFSSSDAQSKAWFAIFNAEHVWVHKHQIDFQSISVLARECNLHKRLILESWFIHIINFQQGGWVHKLY